MEWSSSTWVHTTGNSWDGCHLPGQVRNGEDSSVCPFYPPADWACNWTGGGTCPLPHSRVGVSGRPLMLHCWASLSRCDFPFQIYSDIWVCDPSFHCPPLAHFLKSLADRRGCIEVLMDQTLCAVDLPWVWEVQHLPPWHQGGSVLWWCEHQDPQGPVEEWVPSYCGRHTWPNSGVD